MLERADRIALGGEPRGEVDDDGELGELGRLDRQFADAEPAAGATAFDADHEDRQEGADSRDHDGHGEGPQAAVVGACEADEEDDAHHAPDTLADHEVVGVAELCQGDDEARAVDGNHAGDREDGGQREEGVIGPSGRPLSGSLCGGYGDTS